jgi:hypothetical protein
MLVAACSDSGTPTGVEKGSSAGTDQSSPITADRDGNRFGRKRFFAMLDDCDSASFNAALGAGTCAGGGRTTFDKFIAELQATKVTRKWRFIPRFTEAKAGATLIAVNFGGEMHTFTPVKQFGGGIVPQLNELAGTPDIAPECQALEDDDFVLPGGSYTVQTPKNRDDSRDSRKMHDEFFRVQCCIHPWMKATVKLEHHHT